MTPSSNSSPAIDGVWIPMHAVLGGAPLGSEVLGAITLVIDNGTYAVQNDRGRLLLEDNHRPAAMDMVGEEGPNEGRTVHAIYELRGDVLRICYELGEARRRPEAFHSEPGTLLLLMTCQRKAAP